LEKGKASPPTSAADNAHDSTSAPSQQTTRRKKADPKVGFLFQTVLKIT
jgi:hypothetical protein